MSSETKIKTSITLPESLNQLIEKFSQEFSITKSEIIECATSFIVNLMAQKTLQDIIRELFKYIHYTVKEFLNGIPETFAEIETECCSSDERKCGYGLKVEKHGIKFYKYYHDYNGNKHSELLIDYIYPNAINVFYEITLTHLRYIVQLMSKLFKLKP